MQFKFSHRQKGDSHLGCRQRTTDETLATASFLPSSGGCACATAVVTSLIVSVYMNIKKTLIQRALFQGTLFPPFFSSCPDEILFPIGRHLLLHGHRFVVRGLPSSIAILPCRRYHATVTVGRSSRRGQEEDGDRHLSRLVKVIRISSAVSAGKKDYLLSVRVRASPSSSILHGQVEQGGWSAKCFGSTYAAGGQFTREKLS